MDVKHVNPFIDAFGTVMPQLGFGNIRKGNMKADHKELTRSGIIIIVGIVGAIKGNAVYAISIEDAKKIVSTMMMGMPVNEMDAMAKSALSELTNMLTGHAATCFSSIGIIVDISAPTLLQGDNISVMMSANQVLSLQLLADEVQIEVNIAFEG